MIYMILYEMSQKMSDNSYKEMSDMQKVHRKVLFKLYVMMTSWVVGQLRPLRLHPVGIKLETVNSKRDFESIYFKHLQTQVELIQKDSSQQSTNKRQLMPIPMSWLHLFSVVS